MLQQTPVSRVLPVWKLWMERWPRPSGLACEPSSEAVRVWGRLGYPRRALRLNASAQMITADHPDAVPSSTDELLRLPGVGSYTAAAVAAFAFEAPTVVLDTNVRRVLTRIELPIACPANHVTAAERAQAQKYTDAAGVRAARWSAAVMEFGALICTSRNPVCQSCPIASLCSWRQAGYPEPENSSKTQSWNGTNRQCRGELLNTVRMRSEGISADELVSTWHIRSQAEQCLASLIEYGLVHSDGQLIVL